MRGGITLRHGPGPFVRDPFRATSLEDLSIYSHYYRNCAYSDESGRVVRRKAASGSNRWRPLNPEEGGRVGA